MGQIELIFVQALCKIVDWVVLSFKITLDELGQSLVIPDGLQKYLG